MEGRSDPPSTPFIERPNKSSTVAVTSCGWAIARTRSPAVGVPLDAGKRMARAERISPS
jgi:hypothetical protein